MNTMPPDADPPDDFDARYRRLSAADQSRPSAATRTAILVHAAQSAARRAPQVRRRGRYAALAALAAAAFVGLLVAPRFLQEPPLEKTRRVATPIARNALDAANAIDAPVAALSAGRTAAASAAGVASEQAASRSAARVGQADVNALGVNGHTPLMSAILEGNAAAVDALLARGADAARADADGTTPLQAATVLGHTAIVHSLQRALESSDPARKLH